MLALLLASACLPQPADAAKEMAGSLFQGTPIRVRPFPASLRPLLRSVAKGSAPTKRIGPYPPIPGRSSLPPEKGHAWEAGYWRVLFEDQRGKMTPMLPVQWKMYWTALRRAVPPAEWQAYVFFMEYSNPEKDVAQPAPGGAEPAASPLESADEDWKRAFATYFMVGSGMASIQRSGYLAMFDKLRRELAPRRWDYYWWWLETFGVLYVLRPDKEEAEWDEDHWKDPSIPPWEEGWDPTNQAAARANRPKTCTFGQPCQPKPETEREWEAAYRRVMRQEKEDRAEHARLRAAGKPASKRSPLSSHMMLSAWAEASATASGGEAHIFVFGILLDLLVGVASVLLVRRQGEGAMQGATHRGQRYSS